MHPMCTPSELNETVREFQVGQSMRYARHMIPTQIFYLLVMLTGCLGNSLVIYIYRRKAWRTSGAIFIFWLAVIDLVSCVLILPLAMVEIHHKYHYYSTPLCQFYEWCRNTDTSISCLMLLYIAIDRYLAICRPLDFLKHRRKTTYMIPVNFVVGVIIMTPTAWLFGDATVGFTNESGYIGCICGIADRHFNSNLHNIFRYILIALQLLLFMILSVAYTLVYCAIRCRKVLPHAPNGRRFRRITPYQGDSPKKISTSLGLELDCTRLSIASTVSTISGGSSSTPRTSPPSSARDLTFSFSWPPPPATPTRELGQDKSMFFVDSPITPTDISKECFSGLADSASSTATKGIGGAASESETKHSTFLQTLQIHTINEESKPACSQVDSPNNLTAPTIVIGDTTKPRSDSSSSSSHASLSDKTAIVPKQKQRRNGITEIEFANLMKSAYPPRNTEKSSIFHRRKRSKLEALHRKMSFDLRAGDYSSMTLTMTSSAVQRAQALRYKTAKTLVAVSIVYLLCWLPYWIMVACGVIDEEPESSDFCFNLALKNLFLISRNFYFSSYAANPIVYAFINTRFREELLILFRKVNRHMHYRNLFTGRAK